MFGQRKNNLENKYIYNLKGSNNIDWITLNGILTAIFQVRRLQLNYLGGLYKILNANTLEKMCI